jgi:hypothetical protein
MRIIKSSIAACTLFAAIFVPQISLAKVDELPLNSGFHSLHIAQSTLRDLIIGSDAKDSEANGDEVEADPNPTRTVRISNNGRQVIREVYIANHQDSKWGKDLLYVSSILDDDPGIHPNGTADFTLRKSSYRVYMSGYNPSSGVYREEATGTAALNLKGCQFDIRVVFKDRKASEKRNVDICERDSFEFSD